VFFERRPPADTRPTSAFLAQTFVCKRECLRSRTPYEARAITPTPATEARWASTDRRVLQRGTALQGRTAPHILATISVYLSKSRSPADRGRSTEVRRLIWRAA
jgi:hypothetical protein